jgi:hypothetical protein
MIHSRYGIRAKREHFVEWSVFPKHTLKNGDTQQSQGTQTRYSVVHLFGDTPIRIKISADVMPIIKPHNTVNLLILGVLTLSLPLLSDHAVSFNFYKMFSCYAERRICQCYKSFSHCFQFSYPLCFGTSG